MIGTCFKTPSAVLFVFFLSCAPSLEPSKLMRQGPHVARLSPDTGARVGLVTTVYVQFSEPILPSTVTEKSFMIARLLDENPLTSEGVASVLVSQTDSLERLSGRLVVTDDGLGASWEPTESLLTGTYQVILMPTIRSITHRPLNQTVYAGTEPFVSWFMVHVDGEDAPGLSPVSDDKAESLSDPPVAEGDGSDDTSNKNGISPKPDDASTQPLAIDIESEVTTIEKNGVVFTEVVTDPQRDWNDSAGGNGIFFDSIPGNGTIGSSDEWIELSNQSDKVVGIHDWKIEMIDGSDEIEFFSAPGSALFFSSGGSVDSFLPGEFLVVGNPPGDLKNTILFRLIDGENQIVDEINVEDGNADGAWNESYRLMDEGEWQKGESTIGF